MTSSAYGVYTHLPIFAQHLAATWQGARYARVRYGGEYESHLRLLRQTEFASGRELEELQRRSLLSMVAFAARYVPYYRRLFAEAAWQPHCIDHPGDLARVPLTEKDSIRRCPFDFIARFPFRETLIPWNTSGTTGSPMTFYYELAAVQRQYAFVELYRNQASVSRADRRAQFTGKMIVPPNQSSSQRVFWRRDAANNTLLLSTVHLQPDNIRFYARALREFGPVYLTGYPSAMYILAQYCLLTGEELPKLRAALTSAETLLPHQRTAIETAFQTHVFDQYGQAEMQSFWFECSSGSMHPHPLAGITEILRDDGSPVGPGEEGDVVLTGLLNRAMPLLRYRVGDRATFGRGPCPCGRNMPVIESISGRVEDYVYTRERGYVSRLDPVFKGVSGIVESQVVQESLDLLKVFYVPASNAAANHLTQLLRNLRAAVGEKIEIRFIQVEHIPRNANGKFRAVVCLLPWAFRSGEVMESCQVIQ